MAKRKGVSQLLTVLKHALFKAITIAAGGADPDLCNQVGKYGTYLRTGKKICKWNWAGWDGMVLRGM